MWNERQQCRRGAQAEPKEVHMVMGCVSGVSAMPRPGKTVTRTMMECVSTAGVVHRPSQRRVRVMMECVSNVGVAPRVSAP